MIRLKATQRLSLLFFLLLFELSAQNSKDYKLFTIAFYNLENLFDTKDDPITFDNDWTPGGKYNWTEYKYSQKLKNLARVISDIGRDKSSQPPVIIGVCEAENLAVLEALVQQPGLKDYNYSIIHFDSPDRRGIDVALLYRTGLFVPVNERSIRLLLYEEEHGKRIYTRDQLVVSGNLDGEPIHLLVNHWPSKRGGDIKSRPRRIKAARRSKQIIDSLFSIDPYAKIICMGDFNDDPNSVSIRKGLNPVGNKDDLKFKRMFNPMEKMFKRGFGTLAYRDNWNLFDQILVSTELLRKDNGELGFYKAGIHNSIELQTASGRYKGYPFRSNNNGRFTGGFSDHFPVFIYLIKEMDNSEEN